ncbi:MAG: hypothetical protein R2709_14760 [Marmoricola sp.]
MTRLELIERASREFTEAYVAGNDDEARRLYPPPFVARGSASRPSLSPSAIFDPKTDAREADLEPGQKWSGWHLIEKDLGHRRRVTPR